VAGTLCFWRFLLGLGIGGDYPLSATIMSEYSSTSNRGAYVGSVFAMQGIGILVAAAVTAIVAACFNAAYHSESFPTSVPGCYSWTQLTSSSASGTCPTANQQAYYDQVLASTPPEMDFVWRIVLAFGAFPAACTMYFRSQMKETPRYVARVAHDAQRALREAQAEEVMTASVTSNRSTAADDDEPAAIAAAGEHDWASFCNFLNKHKYELLGCAVCWFCLDIGFYSQNLFQKYVFLQAGFIPPATHMTSIEETAKIARAQAIIALGSTIPGYWFTVFFVDWWGRKPIQIMGFVLMTAFMAALAGSERHLLNPNNHTNTALSNLQPTAGNGWITMYALCFFFANFGPNATTFIVPAELFPTKWRSTGHGIAAACGKLGAIVGGFGFLYASQPAPGETTFAYPCNSNYPSDLKNGACIIKNNCPAGRATPSGAALGATCSVCTPHLLSGCYPFGIGLASALGLLAAINFVGLLFTYFIPETKGVTLESLNGEEEEAENVKKKRKVMDGYDKIEQQLEMVVSN
jgi:PHS family inorganic phosphate transporter-like MFS transporter